MAVTEEVSIMLYNKIALPMLQQKEDLNIYFTKYFNAAFISM